MMRIQEKRELVRLLNLYQNEILDKMPETYTYHAYGLAAQYDHARILSAKLSVEIRKEMKIF